MLIKVPEKELPPNITWIPLWWTSNKCTEVAKVFHLLVDKWFPCKCLSKCLTNNSWCKTACQIKWDKEEDITNKEINSTNHIKVEDKDPIINKDNKIEEATTKTIKKIETNTTLTKEATSTKAPKIYNKTKPQLNNYLLKVLVKWHLINLRATLTDSLKRKRNNKEAFWEKCFTLS